MSKIKAFVYVILALLLSSNQGLAVELWLKDIPLNKLQSLYQETGYVGDKNYQAKKDYLMLYTHKYPAIFLEKFPQEFFDIEDEEQRSTLFIKMLIPLALKLNIDLLAERQIIANIAKDRSPDNLNEKEIEIIEKKATKYDIFTRLKGEERYRYLLSELLLRIDVIPPSIIISTAAIDTNYGASRAFKEGNSLYKILNWNTDEGLKPVGDEDADYRLRTYPDIYSSIQDFALRVNSHPNFAFIRHTRSTLREDNDTPYIQGRKIVAYSFANSELKNYAGIIDYTLNYHELAVVDRSALDIDMVTPQIAKKYSRYVIKK